jgi:hypothetical protein
MTTRWKGNFINFLKELYFDICSVLDRGGNPLKRDSGDGDDNIEEKGDQ